MLLNSDDDVSRSSGASGEKGHLTARVPLAGTKETECSHDERSNSLLRTRR